MQGETVEKNIDDRSKHLRAAVLSRLDVIREMLVGPTSVPKVNYFALSSQ